MSTAVEPVRDYLALRPQPSEAPMLDAETRARLRALGYEVE